MFQNQGLLEAHLLLLGMMYRDMDLALFEHDPDGGGYERPAYLAASTVSDALFSAAAGFFAFLANSIPRSPLPVTPTTLTPSSVTVNVQVQTHQQTVPKPRRPPRTPATGSVKQPPIQDHSAGKNTERVHVEAEAEQAIRRGIRERHAPKRFDESDSEEPAKKTKGARGRGRGGRGKGK